METKVPSAPVVPRAISRGPAKRGLFRRPVIKTLQGMRCGDLALRLPEGEVLHFGEGGEPQAHMTVHSDQFFRDCALYGGVGLGESYVAGDWDTNDIRAVIEWFIGNIASDPRLKNSSQRFRAVGWLRFANRVGHWMRPNSLRNSRRNIAEHYDLGNDFYRLWLDETMTYSAARYTAANQTLEAAQLEKSLDQSLFSLPVARIVITLGAKGARMIDTRSGDQWEVEGIPVEAVDTTGAGDTFAGYLAAGLHEGMQPEAAMRFAGRAAALKVTRHGTADAIPTRVEVEAFSS